MLYVRGCHSDTNTDGKELNVNDLSNTPAVAPVAEAAGDPNTFVFRIPNTETDISIVLGNIPADIRLDMLKKSVKDYVMNSVNQANVRANKANAPFDQYDEAIKADPLQTAVPKPTGERVVPDLIGTAAAARERLYKGEVRKVGEGEGKTRERVDPLTQMVTKAVVTELFDKKKALDSKYKIMDAQKEVGKDGIAYLKAKIAEKVATGADEAALNKFMEDRYIKPAKLMLGQSTTKATADQSLL